MPKKKMPLEADVVAWLESLIEGGGLVEAIQGLDSVTSVTDTLGQPLFLPSFGIDYASRRASAEAAKHVLSCLEGLEIVSVDTSVSMTKGEVLRPDVLCFNRERKMLVVFEVKRAGETERQTVTELAGYEQELRNLLPFLGSFDVCFVVVAADWTTLLTHAIGSMNAWSGKRCLALRLSEHDSKFELNAFLPEAWHLTGNVSLPPEALPSIDLYLVDKQTADDEQESSQSDEEHMIDEEDNVPPRIVLTAMDIIARAGDSAGSHGFMMLWRDVHGDGRGKWCITVTSIDPYAMFAWCREHGFAQRDSEATAYFQKCAGNLWGKVSQTTREIAMSANVLLQEHFSPELNSECLWQMKRSGYRTRVVPTRFEFWGSVGKHAREFVSNAAVRNQYMPFVKRQQLDWTDPAVGMTLVANLSLGEPFTGGMIKCSDAFLVGRVLGNLIVAAYNAAPDKPHADKIEPMVEWDQLEALRFAVEMKQIASAAKEVTEPMPVLSYDPARRLAAAEAIAQWVMRDLIGDRHPFHQACFDLGCRYALLFNLVEEGAADCLGPDTPADAAKAIRRILLGALDLVDDGHRALSSPGYIQLMSFLESCSGRGAQQQGGSSNDRVSSNVDDKSLLNGFSSVVVSGLDSIIPVVLHSIVPAHAAHVDWEWLKAGIRAMFESGDHCPAIKFSQDGMIGSARLEGPLRILPPIRNPAEEVYVVDEASSRIMALKMSWDEVKSFHVSRSRA